MQLRDLWGRIWPMPGEDIRRTMAKTAALLHLFTALFVLILIHIHPLPETAVPIVFLLIALAILTVPFYLLFPWERYSTRAFLFGVALACGMIFLLNLVTGGSRSPYALFYLLPVAWTAYFHPFSESAPVAGLVALLFAIPFFTEGASVEHARLLMAMYVGLNLYLVMYLLKRVAAARERTAQSLQDDLLALQEWTGRMQGSIDPDRLCRTIVEGAAALVRADLVALPILAPDGKTFTYREAVGSRAEAVKDVTLPVEGGGLCGWVVAHQQPLLVPDLERDDRVIQDLRIKLGVSTALVVPLTREGKVLGGISAFRQGNPFTEQDVQLLSLFAHHAAAAFVSSQLYQDSMRLFDQIAHAKREWEETFDALSDGVAILDLDDRIVRVNKSFAKRLGSFPAALVGRKCYEAFHDRPDRLPECPHGRCVAANRPRREEIRERDGRDYEVLAFPLHDGEGRVRGCVMVSRDVTDRKLMETQVLQSEKLATVGKLISGIAHEINNPLTSVVGFSELLLAGSPPPLYKERLEIILRESKRAARIVQGLLAFARPSRAEHIPLDLHVLLRQTVEMRAYEQQMKNIRVVWDLAESLPPVQGDPSQIQQVLLNLILNAEQALTETRHSGTITITTRAQREEGRVALTIADDGPGIPSEILPRIFDPFFTTKQVGEGTGLGLAVSYGIIQAHGGEIAVRSREGEGTTFSVSLPIAKHLSSRPPVEAEVPSTPKERRGRVLVIDDEQAVCDLCQNVLEEAGHEVTAIQNGQAALDLVVEQAFDVILSDIRMPEISGVDLYRFLLEHRPLLVRRLVFITGDLANPETRRFLEETKAGVVNKPFITKDLLEAIDSVLEREGRMRSG